MIAKILKWLAITAAGVLLFFWAHGAATEARGYVAYGGELVFLLLPLWWKLIAVCIRDTRRMIREEREQRRDHDGPGE